MLANMCRPAIKPRHWAEVSALVGGALPYESETFALSHIVSTNLHAFKDDVEEISLGAEKQLQLEVQISDMKNKWNSCAFEFAVLKNRDVPMLKGFGVIVEELEEAQLLLQSTLSVRYVAPFKEDLTKLLGQLSDTSETLELWVKVQMLWTSLERYHFLYLVSIIAYQ